VTAEDSLTAKKRDDRKSTVLTQLTSQWHRFDTVISKSIRLK